VTETQTIRWYPTEECKLACKNCYLKWDTRDKAEISEVNSNKYELIHYINDDTQAKDNALSDIEHLLSKYTEKGQVESYVIVLDWQSYKNLPVAKIYQRFDKTEIDINIAISPKTPRDFKEINGQFPWIAIGYPKMGFHFSFIHGINPQSMWPYLRRILSYKKRNITVDFMLNKPVVISPTLHMQANKLAQSMYSGHLTIDLCASMISSGIDCSTLHETQQDTEVNPMYTYIEDSDKGYRCNYTSNSCLLSLDNDGLRLDNIKYIFE